MDVAGKLSRHKSLDIFLPCCARRSCQNFAIHLISENRVRGVSLELLLFQARPETPERTRINVWTVFRCGRVFLSGGIA